MEGPHSAPPGLRGGGATVVMTSACVQCCALRGAPALGASQRASDPATPPTTMRDDTTHHSLHRGGNFAGCI